MIYKSRFSADKYWMDILYHDVTKDNANVATLGANDTSWNAEVQAKIMGTGFFLGVDAIDVSSVSPSLSDLQKYKAVLIYSDGGFANAATLGDNLAAYVDGGGGVVIAVFAEENGPNLNGNWALGGYDPLIIDSQGGGGGTLGVVTLPNHPVMVGVTTFDGGGAGFFCTGGLAVNTELIASWTNEHPLVVEKAGFNGKIICLNFYPPSSDSRPDFWLASTDGAKLMGNALKYVGNL